MSQNAIKSRVTADQIVRISATNSSTANLGAGATFTGTSASTLNVVGIQVSLKTDQHCTVYIDQSPDGTNWDITDSFRYYEHIGNFSQTVQAVSSYTRVRVTNLDAADATTYFRLQTALCPMVEALPRAPTEQGNLKVSVRNIEDTDGHKVTVSPLGSMGMHPYFKLTGPAFGSTTDATYWTMTSGSGGSAATANAVTTVDSGTSNSGYGQMVSAHTARFIAGVPNLYAAMVRIPTTVVALNTRRWGAYTVSTTTPQNGFYFELSAAGVMSVNHVKAGSVTSVASGAWNGITDFFAIDANAHVYEIVYFVREVQFKIDYVVVHTFAPTTSVLTEDLNLRCAATSINTAAGTTSGTIELYLSIIHRLGSAESSPRYVYRHGATAAAVAKTSAGILRRVIINDATSAGTLLLYDALTATNPIALIAWAANKDAVTLEYGVNFSTGLCYTTTGTGTDVTIVIE